jgi:hypothetical protein
MPPSTFFLTQVSGNLQTLQNPSEVKCMTTFQNTSPRSAQNEKCTFDPQAKPNVIFFFVVNGLGWVSYLFRNLLSINQNDFVVKENLTWNMTMGLYCDNYQASK